MATCPACGGSGICQNEYHQEIGGHPEEFILGGGCPECKGYRDSPGECPNCNGTGEVDD